MKKYKILLTGGHAATTALAVIEELLRKFGKEAVEIYWVGSQFALEGKKIQSLEFKIFPKMQVKSYPIIAARLQRRFTIWTIPSLFKLPISFIQAVIYIVKIRPSLTLSFGGYAAFPIVFSSWLFRIPIIIHEQTTAAGLTNRLSSFFAKKILLARKESLKFFGTKKTLVVGNPVMTQICEVKPKIEIGKTPTILVIGGSRGSLTINNAVYEVLPDLLKKYCLIHLAGEGDYLRFKKRKENLSRTLAENYEVYPSVDPMKMDDVYRKADIIVARSGANTVSELMLIKRPSILIPISWSYMNEQMKNAQNAVKFGVAKILKEDELSGERLLLEIFSLIENWKNIVEKVKDKNSPDLGASQKVVEQVESFLK